MRTKEVAYGGISVALLAVCSWISIPLTIPFTFQTFAVFLICLLFGGKRGTLYCLVYILAGAAGLPVFSGFRGGIHVLFDLTGGYIWGFLLSGLVLWVSQRWWQPHRISFILFSMMGLCLCYSFGTIWFLFVSMQPITWVSVGSVLSICVVPFVIPDLIKIVLAYGLGKRLKPFLIGGSYG